MTGVEENLGELGVDLEDAVALPGVKERPRR
jgi:hypothetical protein